MAPLVSRLGSDAVARGCNWAGPCRSRAHCPLDEVSGCESLVRDRVPRRNQTDARARIATEGANQLPINAATLINPLRNEKGPKRKCASGLMSLERETGLEPARDGITNCRRNATLRSFPSLSTDRFALSWRRMATNVRRRGHSMATDASTGFIPSRLPPSGQNATAWAERYCVEFRFRMVMKTDY
ncbi:MAG: hypothetical protein JWM53_4383 [bacterium]|nr:hypothetical protein [bacterium]